MTSHETSPQLFPLKTEGADDIHTGSRSDGTQVLMGVLLPYLVAYFFEPGGALKGGSRQRLRQLPPLNGFYNISDPTYIRECERQTDEWQRELEFTPGLIRVGSFYDEEMGAGIQPEPSRYQDPLSEDPKRRAGQEEDRKAWRRAGMFVLYWGNDYHVDGEGEIVSS